MFARLIAVVTLVACCCVQALPQPAVATGSGSLPGSRPPIFLNNNASLYTFQNPNFGMPGQLAYAFVAVAHEDCRLFNNGAKLMPKHRLLAAECIQANNMNTGGGGGGGGVVIDPITGLPINPGGPGTGQLGINYGRPMNPWQAAAYRNNYAYANGYAGYGPPAQTSGGYTSYPMQPEAVLSTAQGVAATDTASADPAATSKRRSFKGFGSFREHSYGGFTTTLQTNASRSFGKGFDTETADDKKELTEK